MSDKKDEYPVATLHAFLQEASTEFRRLRIQAKLNLIGSIIVLIFISRFIVFVFANYGPLPFHRQHMSHIVDVILLLASLVAVIWSLNVWMKQRKFVSRWGERFEKLDELEKKFLSDENT